MERGFLLLFAAVMVSLEPGVRGTAHLSFANNTQVNITRTGCGVSKNCLGTPDNCDPTGNGTCLFASLIATTPVAPNGTILSIELRGNSAGYVALGLTVNASTGNTQLFVCAQNSSNNGSFFFRTMQRNNTSGKLTSQETTVTEIRGSVEGDVIRCEFVVPGVNASQTRSSHETTFNVLLVTGNITGNTLGPFLSNRTFGPLSLTAPPTAAPTTAAPTTAAPTTTGPTTTAPPTTAGASGVVHSYALLLLLSVLTLSLTQTKEVL